MARSPMMPFWTDAYLGDTRHLTTLEHGAYMLLLITAWRSKEGLLPDDDKMLSRFSGLTIEKWKKIRPVLEDFFTIENGQWAQARLLDERKADFEFRKSQSKKAKARHLKKKETDRAAASCGHMPPPSPSPSPSRKDTNVSSPPISPKGDFDAWWSQYPHKVGKADAKKKYEIALKKACHEELVAGVREYIETKPPDRPWCNPSTWLHQERWLDEPVNVQQTERKANGSENQTDRNRAGLQRWVESG